MSLLPSIFLSRITRSKRCLALDELVGEFQIGIHDEPEQVEVARRLDLGVLDAL